MKNIPYDLGVYSDLSSVYLYSHLLFNKADALHLGISKDGIHFKSLRKRPVIWLDKNTKEDTRYSSNFRISHISDKYVLSYKHTLNGVHQLCLATSKNGIDWKKQGEISDISDTAMVTPEFIFEKRYLMYAGYGEIYPAFSDNLINWDIQRLPVLSPRAKYFDNHPLVLGSVINLKRGILVLYYVKKQLREGDVFDLGAALFDKKNPTQIIWRSEKPLWEQEEEWHGQRVYPMGGVYFKESLYVYFGLKGEGVYAVSLGKLKNLLPSSNLKSLPNLNKHPHNPIISPVLKHVWEASATFNSAAIHEGGKVHFVYRAMGPDNTSVLGYASSSDGTHIDERLKDPIYYPREHFEVPVGLPSINYMSGGGYGGCEDPRITKIDDTLYMTYVAYNGRDAPKIALTSIKLSDFLSKNWIWAKPKIISSPHQVNKNCVIFPEKIQGRFAVMHRVFPDILIDFVDDLLFKDSYLTGHFKISPRDSSWDSRKLGAGAPPIKTKEGWLLIYQAVDDKDPGKYKIGAMLLDLNNPSIVLHRPDNPILEPTEWYENEGFKAGVAYPCGAVVKDGDLIVYYGGADTVICAATAPLDGFLKKLKSYNSSKKYKPLLHKIDIKRNKTFSETKYNQLQTNVSKPYLI